MLIAISVIASKLALVDTKLNNSIRNTFSLVEKKSFKWFHRAYFKWDPLVAATLWATGMCMERSKSSYDEPNTDLATENSRKIPLN